MSFTAGVDCTQSPVVYIHLTPPVVPFKQYRYPFVESADPTYTDPSVPTLTLDCTCTEAAVDHSTDPDSRSNPDTMPFVHPNTTTVSPAKIAAEPLAAEPRPVDHTVDPLAVSPYALPSEHATTTMPSLPMTAWVSEPPHGSTAAHWAATAVVEGPHTVP